MRVIRSFVASGLLFWHAALVAAPGSYSGNIDPGDAGGPLPGASIVIGIIGAIVGTYASAQDSGGLADMAQLAFWGFCIGAILGLPVSCVLK